MLALPIFLDGKRGPFSPCFCKDIGRSNLAWFSGGLEHIEQLVSPF